MKVFVAGGSGAMGRRLVPRLVAEGYEVAAMTRDGGKAAWLSAVGARPVVADALDRAAVRTAVIEAGPEVVIHQLTALSGAGSNLKQFDREFALSLDIADGAVQAVRSVINPDKLAHLGPLSPVGRRSAGPDWA